MGGIKRRAVIYGFLALLGVGQAFAATAPKDLEKIEIYQGPFPAPDLRAGFRELKIGQDRYRIPLGYLMSIDPVDEDGSARGFPEAPNRPGFRFLAFLPNFEPAAQRNLTPGWVNQIDVMVEFGSKFITPEKQISEMVTRELKNKDHYVEIKPNIRFYKLPDYSISGEEVYEFIQDKKIIVASCVVVDVPYPDCDVFENYEDKYSIQYAFPRKYVLYTIEIDDGIESLIKSFKN